MFLLKILFFFVTTLLLKTSGEAEYCKKILAELGNAESNFAYCATTHSVPVEICNGCKKEYDSMKDIFVNFSNDVNCTSRYFDKDRVNLVTTTEESLSSLWTKAYCDDCFRNENIFKFNEKITALEGCIGSNSKHPCESCIGDYKDLNNFYIQMDQHNNGGVCFDIQDSMNRTRTKWSKELKCCRREYNMLLFTVAFSIVSFIFVLFYSGIYFVTKRQERNHGILTNEDPLLNTNAPSTSRGVANIRRNTETLPTTELGNTSPSPERNEEVVEASSLQTKEQQVAIGYSKLNDDEENSSDEDNIAYKK